jgi:putative thioredoxin
MLSPILEKIAREYNGKFILAKVNVDEAQITAGEFGIMSVPTVVLFKNGEPVDYFVGVLPETQIKDWLKRRL